MNQWWAIAMLLSGGLFAGSVGRSPGNPSRLAARRPGRLPDLLRRPLCQVNCRSRPCWPFACLHQLGLTPRDRKALALVANGRSNRQITEALFVSPKTAGVHLSNILAKLGVAGRVDRPPPRPRLLVAEATPAPGPRLPLPTTSHQAMTSPICD